MEDEDKSVYVTDAKAYIRKGKLSLVPFKIALLDIKKDRIEINTKIDYQPKRIKALFQLICTKFGIKQHPHGGTILNSTLRKVYKS